MVNNCFCYTCQQAHNVEELQQKNAQPVEEQKEEENNPNEPSY